VTGERDKLKRRESETNSKDHFVFNALVTQALSFSQFQSKGIGGAETLAALRHSKVLVIQILLPQSKQCYPFSPCFHTSPHRGTEAPESRRHMMNVLQWKTGLEGRQEVTGGEARGDWRGGKR